jgi:DNA recombination protein RmuC
VATRRFDDLGVASAPVPRPGPVEGAVRMLRSVPDEESRPAAAELPLPGIDLGPGGLPVAGRHTAERDGTTG